MWKDLTLEQKAEIMKMSVANRVTDINDIRALYDGSIGYRFDNGGSKKDYIDPNVSIYAALKQAGIPFKTSNPSGYRGPGHYVGKAGAKSQHAQRRPDGTAWALDITGDFDEIRRRINASKPLQDYFRANGITVSEELTKEALARTGGTGPHFHIGRSSGHNHQNNPTLAAFNRTYNSANNVPEIDYDLLYGPSTVMELDWSNRPQQEEQIIQRPTEPVMAIMEREEPSQEQTSAPQDNFIQLPSFRLSSLQSQPNIYQQQRHRLATPIMQVASEETTPEVQSILSSPYIIFGRD